MTQYFSEKFYTIASMLLNFKIDSLVKFKNKLNFLYINSILMLTYRKILSKHLKINSIVKEY
jgi:hypothetical protein